MYAEASIAEYWIVNLVDDCLEVYRGPRPDGTYQEERVLRRGESTDIARPARRGRRRGRDRSERGGMAASLCSRPRSGDPVRSIEARPDRGNRPGRGWRDSMATTRYSVDDYEEMIRLGALTENDRVELIRGGDRPEHARRAEACRSAWGRDEPARATRPLGQMASRQEFRTRSVLRR